MSEDRAGHSEREHFFGAAKMIAGLTLLSRVGGLLRDVTLAAMFGANRLTDAFYLAYMIPNLFRRLFGEGALSAAFVPVFSDELHKQGHEGASALLSNVLGLLAATLVSLYGLITLGLLAVWWFAPGTLDRQWVLGLTAVMMPFMVCVCILAIASAAMNCVKHFAFPPAAPILLNAFIILGALLVAPRFDSLYMQLWAVGLSMVAAGVAQVLLAAVVLRRVNLPIRLRFQPRDPGVRRIVMLALPMLVPLAVLQVNALFDKIIAKWLTFTPANPTVNLFGWELTKPLEAGAVTWVSFGERLYQFPLGVLAVALATAVFPLFSRHAAAGDTLGLRRSVNRAIRLAVFEGLPSGIGLLILAGPLAEAIFARGNFTSYDAGQTAHLVRVYGLGMWAFCTQHILLRAFYALKNTRTPLRVSLVVMVLNFALNLVLIWQPTIRHACFGLSTSITASLNVLVLSWVLRGQLGRLGGRSLLISFARTLLASLAMAGAVLGVRHALLSAGVISPVLLLAACVPTGAATFFVAARLMRAPEIGELLARPGRSQQAE